MISLTIIFAVFASFLVVVSLGSVIEGIRLHRFFERSLRKELPRFTPFASVIVPCRGAESGLKENLEALFAQNYPNHEVIFVTGGEADGSVPVIRGFLDRPHTKLVFAGEAKGESQKVRNLRIAVEAVASESEVFVFVDSDARPSEMWLRSLVAALADESVGVATGYRWFISKKGNFASELRASWNASIASRLGENSKKNFVWGGSAAILRKRFEEFGIADRWKGALSDDYQMMRAVREAGRLIEFVPAAMCASVDDCTFWEMLEFTTRQMKITRVYAGHLWIAGLVGAFLFNLVMLTSAAMLLMGPDVGRWTAIVALSLVWGCSVGKAYVRLRAVSLAMPAFRGDLERQTLPQVTLWIFSPAVFLYNCVAALVSREIVWRGIRYRLTSSDHTEIIG